MKLSQSSRGSTREWRNSSAPCADVVLLVLRLTWGWQFFQTGLGKLRNIERVITFFTSLGIPAPA